MRTDTTARFRKRRVHHVIAAVIDPRPPSRAQLPGWTPGLFGLPVHPKTRQIKAAPWLALPPMVAGSRTEQVDAIHRAIFEQPLGFDVAVSTRYTLGSRSFCCKAS